MKAPTLWDILLLFQNTLLKKLSLMWIFFLLWICFQKKPYCVFALISEEWRTEEELRVFLGPAVGHTVRVRQDERRAAVFTFSRNLLLSTARREMTPWAEILFFSLLSMASLHSIGGKNQCATHLELRVLVVDRWEGMNMSLGASTVCWLVINTSRAGEDHAQEQTHFWIKVLVCSLGKKACW